MIGVLKVKKRDRHEIYESVLDLLDSPGIIIGQHEVVISALEFYIKGKADFGDYLILAESLHYHVKSVASFDKIFCKASEYALSPKSFL